MHCTRCSKNCWKFALCLFLSSVVHGNVFCIHFLVQKFLNSFEVCAAVTVVGMVPLYIVHVQYIIVHTRKKIDFFALCVNMLFIESILKVHNTWIDLCPPR